MSHTEWLVDRFERHLLRPLAAPSADCHAHVSLPLACAVGLFEQMYAACRWLRPQVQPRFLDAGCGIGTKVLLARRIGFDASGVEIHPGYAAAARGLLGSLWRIEEADLRTYAGYGRFDVIYSYTPMRADAGNQIILERMLRDATDGTLLALCDCEGARWPAVERSGAHEVHATDWCRVLVKTTDTALVEKLRGLLTNGTDDGND